jgi:cytochrome c
MRIHHVLTIGLAGIACECPAAPENSPPEVTITAPAARAGFRWNSVVPFSISVTDAEDGKTEFEEITPSEVLLRVAFLPDSSRKETYLTGLSKESNAPLRRMSASNCFTCHTAATKLIGPSFDLIAKRYPANQETVESLAKKVIAGSSGTWSGVAMPPHPDLKIDQAKEMVEWILRNSSDPDRTFSVGYEGAFRTREKPAGDSTAAVYVLTASYKDHGGEERQHTVVLENPKE